jgi:hypothetical protein
MSDRLQRYPRFGNDNRGALKKRPQLAGEFHSFSFDA